VNAILQTYSTQPARLIGAIAGLTPAQLDATPIVGTWTIRQIAIHLADCEQVFAHRIKRCLADKEARLSPFEENLWMAGLAVERRDPLRAAMLLQATRLQVVEILAALGEDSLSKNGDHPDFGKQSVRVILDRAIRHFDHHLEHLDKKRGMVVG
jgi:uncharacterized damage-inducible protein DinB